jgi:signal transduction histidine kinase
VQGIQLAAELETLMHERAYVSNYLLSHDPKFLSEAGPHHAEFEAWIAQMEGFAHTEEERSLMSRMRAQYLGYTAKGDEVVRLSLAGRDDEARQVFFTMKAEVEGLLQNGQQLFVLAEQDMRVHQGEADAKITRERELILWLTGLGAASSLLAGFMLARYVARPLNQLVLRLGAQGGTARVEFNGDELGFLETQVNALLDRVRNQERALQQAEKLSELGELAAEIAHETLNPLAGASAMLQVLRRGSVPPERLGEELGAIERELRRVEEIVRRLMRYARPLEPHVRRVALAEVVEHAGRTARSTPAAAGRVIESAEVPAVEWVLDPALIEQVLVNLLVNACEASPAGATVELRAFTDATSVRFEVRDHGPGVTQEQRQRLFKPFFTTKPNGNGLGLAVSRNIVLEHGGRIEADASEGGGATFKVTLPRGESTWGETSWSSTTKS